MATKLPQIQPHTSKTSSLNDKKVPARTIKKRSVSEVEDPISQLKKNLFSKLERYDRDENQNLNKSFGVADNNDLKTRKENDKRTLNQSFSIEQSTARNSSKRNSINQLNQRNLLEDDDMTDEQFLSDICGDQYNLSKGKSDKILLGSTLSQTKPANSFKSIRNSHNVSFQGSITNEKATKSKNNLNSSFSNSIQQENLNEEKYKQPHKAPFLTNILDQIDQNSNVIRSKNNFNKIINSQYTITPKKIISDSKTLNVNYQINNNIANMQAINSLSDKKDNKIKLNNHTQQIAPKNISINEPFQQNSNSLYQQQPKEKKVIFYTPFQNQIMQKEKDKLDLKTTEFNVENTTISQKKKPKHKKSKSENKELPEYSENYTGIESFDESDNSEENDNDDEDQQILQDYTDYYESNCIEEEEYQLSNQLVNIKKECQELDNDLFSLRDLLQGMRGDWKEYEELGAEFEGIDSFIKEVDMFQKEKTTYK
ncbi:hypothetical protein ABPG72_015009 [Tetrahymena utriculariae]